MTNMLAAKTVLTVTALYGGVGAFIADWNDTHIHNPAWPPHAKFHNAQTMSLGAGLAAMTAAVLWRGGRRGSQEQLVIGTALASLYCATQVSALAYPGTALVDPPAKRGPQGWIAAGVLVLNAVTYMTARARAR